MLSKVRFNRVPEKIPEKVGRLWCRIRFNRIPEKILEKVLGSFGAESSQKSTGFRKNLGGFGVKPNQVVQCSRKVTKKVW